MIEIHHVYIMNLHASDRVKEIIFLGFCIEQST